MDIDLTPEVTGLPAWLTDFKDRLKRTAFPVGLLSFAATAVSVFLPNQKALVYVIVGLIILAIIFSRQVEWLTQKTLIVIRIGAPYIVLGILLVVVETRSAVRKIELKLTDPYPPVQVAFRGFPLSGLFNASDDDQIRQAKKLTAEAIVQLKPGYTHVFTTGDQGREWFLSTSQASDREVSFAYDRHEDGLKADWISSGGYVSFPDAPVNRLVYRYLTFDCKVTAFDGQPDIGLRLVVDDLRAPESNGVRQVKVYELKTLNLQPGSRPLSDSWQKYEVDARSLEESGVVLSFSQGGIDPNQINKIVFFITDAMTQKSGKGTVWVRNVVFSTRM